VINRSKDKP
jgi:hypothetical protein